MKSPLQLHMLTRQTKYEARMLFHVLALCALSWNSLVFGEPKKFAQGMVIYRSVQSDPSANYNGALYTKASPGGAWVEFDVGLGKPLRLENGQIVRDISFVFRRDAGAVADRLENGQMVRGISSQSVFESEFTADEHLAFNQQIQSTLTEAAKQSPKLSKLTQAVIDAIQAQIDNYRKDMVRHRGAWIDRNSYAEMIRIQNNDAQKILERLKNLKADYTPAVVKPLLADFDVFTLRAGALSSLRLADTATNLETNNAMFTTSLGKLDATLRSRSKELPGSISIQIDVGLYPSDSIDGPAVLWAAKNDNLVALDVGICIKYSQADQKLINAREVDQAKFFLSKFDDTIFETVADVVASAKIKAVLNPVPLNENYGALQKQFFSSAKGTVKRESVVLIGKLSSKKGEFTMFQKETAKYKAILLVGKPTTLSDGSVRQMAIVQLR